jgi:hypothetical protein
MDPNSEHFGTVVYGAFYFIGLALPLVTFWILRRLFPARTRGFHSAVSIVVVWISLVAYMFWTTPMRIVFRNAQRDPQAEMPGMWDGTAENSGTLILGWLLPTFSLLVFLGLSRLIRLVWNSRRGRNRFLNA